MHNTSHRLWEQIPQKTFTHTHRETNTDCDLTSLEQQSQRFSTCFHSRLPCLEHIRVVREREREREEGAQVHGALIFSIHFLIFLPFSFPLCVVTCQQRALLFAQCHFVIVCIVFCIFVFFIQEIVIFSASTWVSFALFPAPLAITKG